MFEHELTTQKEEANTPEGIEHTQSGRTYVPRVDIFETEEQVVLFADVPGVDEKSLDVTLEKNVLTITGFVHFEAPQGYELAHAEYGIGNYQRSFTLSNEVDRDRISAVVKQGVLQLAMPKVAGARSRKISVKAG